jgi:uncharacterized membrane protein YfcA
VPVLYEAFGWLGVPEETRMPLSIGTSLAVIIPTSFASFAAHHRRGAVDMRVLKAWAVPIIAGVAVGSILAHYATPLLFKLVFVGIALLTAARLMWSERLPRLGIDLPGGVPLAGYGVMIGASSSLMGIGGGLLGNVVMSLYGRPIHQAVATSSGIGVLVSLPGAIGYIAAGWDTTGLPPLSLGFVSVVALLLLMPTSVLTARWGVALAHQLSKPRLEQALACYLVLISIRFVISF